MINEAIVNEFIELVKVDVESKDERAIADVLKNKLKKIGCNVIEDNTGEIIGGNAGNIIAKLKGDKGIPPILLSAHMDRVKKGKNISPVIEENRIKSDGTTILAADDVAGIVSILSGIRKIKEENLKHGDIEIVFSVCEEKGISGSKYLDYSDLQSKIAYVFDSPGNIGRIVNQAPAKTKISIRIFGKPAHAGNEPEKGINAIRIAGVGLSKVNEGRISKYTTSNFGIIKGGEATNVVCDYLELIGEVRSTRKEELESYRKHVEEVFREAASKFNAKIEIDFEDSYDTFYIREDENISKILTKAMKAIGVEYHFSSGGGGMDANRFNKAGIQAVGIATGYRNNHTLQEEIVIKDLIKSGELVKQIAIEAGKINGGGLLND